MPTVDIVDDELINAPFYQGFQTRTEADALLRRKNGSFLVRLVQVDDDLVYVVSVFWRGIKHHYRIYQTKHKNFYYLNSVPKPTIPSLIRFHRFTQTPVNAESGARLRGFVERTHYALYREQLTTEIGVLGHGQFGEVHRGKLQLGFLTNVDVAIKQLLREDGDHVTVSERIKFLREANLMMRLRHKNVVRLYGVVIYNDPILIVTEYAEGGSLLDRLQRKKNASRAQKLNFCRDICFGMAYLERECVIHRDLAARNCLLAKDDCVKIADFGLSLVGKTTIVRAGRAPIRYCPPETLRRGIFSNKTDVWSYGVVLFEIWSNGEEPYANVRCNKALRQGVVSGDLRLEPPKGMPLEMVKLMRVAHSEDADKRPEFAHIARRWFGGEKRTIGETISSFFRSLAFVF